jgi:hypothetical protein
MATVGEIVHVHWDTGTQWGLGGTTVRLEYTVEIKNAVEAGYGYLTLQPGDSEMAAPNFGRDPIVRDITVTKGADFAQILRPEGGAKFPAGTTARIDVLNRATEAIITTWPANVTPDEATWIQQSTAVDAVPDKSLYRLYLVFPTTPPLDMCWYEGQIKRSRARKS